MSLVRGEGEVSQVLALMERHWSSHHIVLAPDFDCCPWMDKTPEEPGC